MYAKIVLNTILVLAVFILHIAFIRSLPAWLGQLDFFLVILAFILVFNSFSLTASWALGLGLLMDIFSFGWFGLNMLSLFIALVLTKLLLDNYFTNRSVYSFLALTLFFSVFFRFFSLAMAEAAGLLIGSGPEPAYSLVFWSNQARSLLMNLLFTVIIFYTLSLFSINLRPATLAGRK